jgi:PhnB protein
MQISPYLSFEGRCEEAIEFYRKALGAEVTRMMRFKDMPGGNSENCPEGVTPGTENKVMHAEIRIGQSTVLLSDGRCQAPAKFHGIALTLEVPDAAVAQKVFAALADGGQVNMPLEKTFFSPAFGMVADRFGVGWMVIVRA